MCLQKISLKFPVRILQNKVEIQAQLHLRPKGFKKFKKQMEGLKIKAVTLRGRKIKEILLPQIY